SIGRRIFGRMAHLPVSKTNRNMGGIQKASVVPSPLRIETPIAWLPCFVPALFRADRVQDSFFLTPPGSLLCRWRIHFLPRENSCFGVPSPDIRTAVHISFLHPFRLAVCRMFFITPDRLTYCFCRLRIRRLLDRLRRCIFITLLYCCLFCIPGILLLSQRSCCDRSCKKY